MNLSRVEVKFVKARISEIRVRDPTIRVIRLKILMHDIGRLEANRDFLTTSDRLYQYPFGEHWSPSSGIP